MKTSKPFSTISYNSVDFLKYRLDMLINSGKILFYVFIKYFGEFDVQRNEREKEHIYLFIESNGSVDTDDILTYFVEIDHNNPTKPFTRFEFRSKISLIVYRIQVPITEF